MATFEVLTASNVIGVGQGGGSSYLVYKGAIKGVFNSVEELVIRNTLGGSFIRDSAGVYINFTDTDWPGDDKIFAQKLYPLRGVLYAGTSIQGFWTMDVYEDGLVDPFNKVTIEVDFFDVSGNPIDLENIVSSFFYLPEINAYP